MSLTITFDKAMFNLKKLSQKTDQFASRYQELNRATAKYSELYNTSIKSLVEYVDQVKEKYPTEWQEQLDKEARQEERITRQNALYEQRRKEKESKAKGVAE